MATVIPRREVVPIDLMLRNALGRDLTAEERKYLALSAIAMPSKKTSLWRASLVCVLRRKADSD